MLKACIEKIHNGESTWIPLPNGDLSSAIFDFTDDRDWECTIITGLKEDGITSFVNNSFHKCDIFQLNNLLLWLQKVGFSTNSIEHLVVLNLFLEDRNFDCNDVKAIYDIGSFRVYRDAENMGDVARSDMDNDRWDVTDFIKQHIDYDSLGESLLSDGNYLQDKRYKVIVEVFE